MRNTEIKDNIAQDLYEIYRKVKLYTFHRIFRKITTKEEDSLTALEVLSLDLIQGNGKSDSNRICQIYQCFDA